MDNRPAACWVVPFGNPRIKGYLLLNAAYRSLSRPSSPVRAKASAIRPLLLSLDFLVMRIHPHGRLIILSAFFTLACYFIVSNMSKIPAAISVHGLWRNSRSRTCFGGGPGYPCPSLYIENHRAELQTSLRGVMENNFFFCLFLLCLASCIVLSVF